nr:hypothetical protein [Bradyrhizobium sp. 197]
MVKLQRQDKAGDARDHQHCKAKLQRGQATQVDRGQTRADERLCLTERRDLGAAAFRCQLARVSRHGFCVPRRSQQNYLTGIGASLFCDVVRVGYQEGVLWSCRKLEDDADELERNNMILMVACVLKPQVQAVAGLQLEVVHRFLRDQNTIRCLG